MIRSTTLYFNDGRGILPQLCVEITERELADLIQHDGWWAQEKFDGQRVLVQKHPSGEINGINKKGLTIPLPIPVALAASRCGLAAFVIDGELIGDTLHAFDILEVDNEDWKVAPYQRRQIELDRHFRRSWSAGSGGIRLVHSAKTTADKSRFVDALRRTGGEGVVLRDRSAKYLQGRGGGLLKLKFVATASVICSRRNQKRSVDIQLADGTPLGSVSIPLNLPLPAAGAICEIRYLYAYRGGGLSQPVYLGERTDVDRHECTAAQLKYKNEAGLPTAPVIHEPLSPGALYTIEYFASSKSASEAAAKMAVGSRITIAPGKVLQVIQVKCTDRVAKGWACTAFAALAEGASK